MNRSTRHPWQSCLALLMILCIALAGLPANAGTQQLRDAAASTTPIPVHLAESGIAVDAAATYRVQLTLRNPPDLERIHQLGAVILEHQDRQATVLATSDQLESLARLRLQPRHGDQLAALLASAGLDGQTVVSEDTILGLLSLDSDGDGLTDTEEQWWCTDPNDPNTDADAQGYTDGQEVFAVLDFTLPRSVRWGYGPPFGPPAAWPDWNGQDGDPDTPACNDGDWDTIPDFAEVYMVGSHVPEESTDYDKFDDGQELFGVTYCPGAPTSCGYGNYPRIEYWNFIKATMPNWVEPPGDNLFVAAFPIPEVFVVPGSWTVNRVTVITTEEGEMTQTTHSYETSVTRGQSTSIADTVTWNNWEEVSQSVERPMDRMDTSRQSMMSCEPGSFLCRLWGSTKMIYAELEYGALNFVCEETHFGCFTRDAAEKPLRKIYESALTDNLDKDTLASAYRDCLYTKPDEWCATGVSSADQAISPGQLEQEDEYQSLAGSLDGIQFALNQQGQLLARGLYDISYAISRPRLTESHTTGSSWGGSQTTTHAVYEEHTIAEGQAFTTGQNWSTAWAVDSSHAADLTFNYVVQNTGTEYAREITGLVFNVYLGDDPNPIVSYPAWQQFPNGKLENVFPGDTHDFASTSIPLTMDQMRRIDLGERLTVVLEDYSYGADELFYQDAVDGGVTVFVEDGVDDGDELVDLYVIPTWGTETVQDVLTRFFPAALDDAGNLNSLWTPEFDGINPPTWHEHFLSDIAWWNVYFTQADAGDTPLHELPAQQGSALLFRFNRDSDRDGYQDRVELQHYCSLPPSDPDAQYCGVAQDRADIHPQPEVLAGYVATRTGDEVTVLLKVANLGTFDAYGIDAVMYGPDDTVTIGNNTVGGNGRVRPGHQAAVGSLILPPDLADWTNSTAKPYAAGNYVGSADITYTLTVATPGVVGQGSTALSWSDGVGGSGTLALGSSYHAPLPIDVANGLQLGFDTGTTMAGESFTVRALTPRDTFTYTINVEPYTAPVIVVSYSDPQGSHRFVTPVQLGSLADDLSAYTGQMLPDPSVAVETTGPVVPAAGNTTDLIVNNPTSVPIEGGHLYLNFVSDGDLVAELPYTLTLEPGPTVIPVEWSTDVFSVPYNADADNIVVAFWTDAQKNIIDSAARPFPTFQEDPQAEASVSTTAWDFGTVTQGTLLETEIALANTGFVPLRVYGMGSDVTFASPYLTVAPGTFQTLHLTLNTATLPTGPYNATLTLRTNDVSHPQIAVSISGTIEPLAGQALAHGVDEYLPWDQYAYVPGPHEANDVVTFDHTIITDPDRIHPLYVYSQDGGTLLGVGEYGPDFSGQTAPYGMFGDGTDGDLTVGPGQTFYTDGIRSALASTAAGGQLNLVLSGNPGFGIGHEVLVIEMQGSGVGTYEFGTIADVNGNTLTLQDALVNAYEVGGNSKAQVIRVPHYRNVSIEGTLTISDWDGVSGGVLAIRASQVFNVMSSGAIVVDGKGYRGGQGGQKVPDLPGGGFGGSYWQDYHTARGSEDTCDPANGGGGGGGHGHYGGGDGTGGGGGGYGEVGSEGSGGGCRGAGGGVYGIEEPTSIYVGSGGGGGGKAPGNDPPMWGGSGGDGGGAAVIFARELQVIGSIHSSGDNGTNANQIPRDECGGGGGGSGGRILITVANGALGDGRVTATGGAGGSGSKPSENGGNGGAGRIDVQYCKSLSGSTVPPAGTQQITCYITRQLPGSPNTELTLPDVVADFAHYRLQYGQRGTFTVGGTQDYAVTLPKRVYSAAGLDALFENLQSTTFTFTLDIGADGSVEWSGSGTEQPAIFSSPDLAAGLNAYLASTPDPWGAGVVVPIRVTLDTAGDVFLTNVVAVPGGDSDPQVGAGDLTASDTTPVETDLVTLTATIHNLGYLPAENVVASFFAGDPAANGVYVGSGYLPSIPAGSSGQAVAVWDTTGYSGTVDVYVVVDAAGQLAELNEENNRTAISVGVQTRPDLSVAAINLNGPARQGLWGSVSVVVSNGGGTDAASQLASLYVGDPDSGGTLIGSQAVTVPAGGSATATIPWRPSTLGPQTLFAIADSGDDVSEFDEANNIGSQDVYVGWGDPVYIDAGGTDDPGYDPAIGYGYLVTGTVVTCGDEPYQSYRQGDSGTQLQYRFDYLLPDRFYHLDLAFYLCSGTRTLRVLIDGVEVAGSVVVAQQPVYLSLLLDPGLYNDHTIVLGIEKVSGLGGPVVSQLKLTDIRYCYRDSGVPGEVGYTTAPDGCGWLNGNGDQGWGSLPYQTVRYDDDTHVRYQFDGLESDKKYRLNLTFYEGDAAGRVESVVVDGVTVLSDLHLGATPQELSVDVPDTLYGDGTIAVTIAAPAQPVVSEIAVEEKTVDEGGIVIPTELVYLPLVLRRH